MDYRRHYSLLIERARCRSLEGYSERHHIVPRCMGGGNEGDNLVRLTAEEHFVAHQLLVKMYPKHGGLAAALVSMCGNGRNHRRSNKFYAWFRKLHGAAVSARLKGVPKTAEHRAALSRAKMGKAPNRGDVWRARNAAANRRTANTRDLSFTQAPEYRASQSEQMKRVWAERRAARNAE